MGIMTMSADKCDHIIEIANDYCGTTVSGKNINYDLFTIGDPYKPDYYACKYCPDCGEKLDEK